MGTYCNQYSAYQRDTNFQIAATLLYGFLGDAVSEEKKISILKKLSLPYWIANEDLQEVQAVYPDEGHKGGKFFDALLGAQDNELKEKTVEGSSDWKLSNMFRYNDDERMEPAFEEFHKGMGELLEVLEQHAKDIKIKEPNAKNYYNFLYNQLKDSYEGTLEKKLDENAWYAEAIAMTAKIAFPTGILNVDVKTGKLKMGTLNGAPVETVLKETAGLGFVEMLMGGMRLHQKEEECVKTGKVSRQELLHEYAQQNKRLENLSNVSEAKSKELQDKNVIQNGMDEFTDGARGVKFAVSEMEARRMALEMGYPVEDLSVISAFYSQIKVLDSKMNYLQKDIDNKQDPKEKSDLQAKLGPLKHYRDVMQAQWDKICENANPLDAEKRRSNLNRLKSCVKTIREEGYKPSMFSDYEKRVDRRMEADLSAGDKAMLANDRNAMLDSLNAVDPKSLFTGSKQFKAFKTALERLVEMEADYDPEDRMKNDYLTSEKRKVMEKAQEYLRYKDRQINGPKGKKHKRSELEKNRVQTVEGIYNRLLSEVKVQLPEVKLADSERAVVANADDSRLLEGPAVDNTPSFENYIKLHTGKGAMSGTKDEMVDDLAKTLAAQTLPNQKHPQEFSVDEIHKAADTIKVKFDLVNMKEADLRNALENPDKAKKAAVAHYKEVYTVKPENYNRYVNSMRYLHANLEMPAANSTAYRAVFDAVKRAASLPKTLDGIDKKKLQDMTADINAEIFSAIDKYVKKHAKGMGIHDDKVLHVLATMNRRLDGVEDKVTDIVDTINNAKGAHNLADHRHVQIQDYGTAGYYKLEESANPNQLDPNTRSEMRDMLKTMSKTRDDMKKLKEATAKQPKAKDVTETKKHKKLEEVKAKPMSRQI